MRTGVQAAADVGHEACGISPLGGGHHQPKHKATEQTMHELQSNYTKEMLAQLRTGIHNRFPNLRIQKRD